MSILSVFSCSFERVHVPEANVSVGVMSMLNKRNLCRSRYDFDVNSCLYWVSDAQAALIRLLISVVSCCSKIIVLPEILRTFFHWQNLNFDVVDRHLFTSVLSLVAEIFRLFRVDFQSCICCTFLHEVAHHTSELLQGCSEQ